MWRVIFILVYIIIFLIILLYTKPNRRPKIHPLTCFRSPYPKQRVGKDFDGGYIVCNIPNVKYGCLISGGILDDISFEEEFCMMFPNAHCYTYDGTIDGIHTDNKRIHFTKKNIGGVNTDKLTNLHTLFEKHNDIFIKMDIEGGEVAWINSLRDEHFDKINQMVIEFHNPFGKDELRMFHKINKHLLLVHIHGNNCCPTKEHNGILTPHVFECTYINKRFVDKPYKPNTDPLPSRLDMRNVVASDYDIDLNYPPFVN